MAMAPLSKRPSARDLFVDLGDHSVPLYKTIKSELTRSLTGESVRRGMALPTEKELAQRYGVSVGTVRRALHELVSEKVVVRQQGRGTFLAPFDTSRMINSFWHIRRKDGEREAPIVRTLRFAHAFADREVASRLGIAEGSPTYAIRNLMSMSGRAVLVDDLQLPCELFPDLTEERFVTRDATVYDLYRDGFGVNVVKTADHLSAVAADRETARLLDLKAGAPLLEITRIAFTFAERPVEFRRSLLDSTHHEFVDVTGGESGR
jgi:GntR family transcriptional regulator